MTEEKRGRGAPLGNKNAQRPAIIRNAITAAMEEDPDAIREWSRVSVAALKTGTLFGLPMEHKDWLKLLEFFRDTHDGKPRQAMELTGDPDNPITAGFVLIPRKND
jgi:hypothetical protein